MKRKQPKRTIRTNVWDNISGYEGTRKTQDFGTQDEMAQHWLKTGKRDSSLVSLNRPNRISYD
ncbi:MAG: hypothetical protein WCL08_13675 [Verrucomicrobiota bacterium]